MIYWRRSFRVFRTLLPRAVHPLPSYSVCMLPGARWAPLDGKPHRKDGISSGTRHTTTGRPSFHAGLLTLESGEWRIKYTHRISPSVTSSLSSPLIPYQSPMDLEICCCWRESVKHCHPWSCSQIASWECWARSVVAYVAKNTACGVNMSLKLAPSSRNLESWVGSWIALSLSLISKMRAVEGADWWGSHED